MSQKINVTNLNISEKAEIHPDVEIDAEIVNIEAGVVIESGVKIRAKEVSIGYKTVIQRNCQLGAINQSAELIQIGDFSFVGYDTNIMVPRFIIGDYVAIHNHVLVNGYSTCKIGHNSFIGQHSLLNATEELLIGNNFRMALNGYIWTHAESGELLEGCNFYHRTPTIIEDDVWLTGCNISISPNVRLAKGSIILMGSVVVKDTLPRHCYSGVPAQDVTEKMKPYRDVTLEEKLTMMKGFVGEFIELNNKYASTVIEFIDNPDEPINDDSQIVIIHKGTPKLIGTGVSVFSLSDKTYIKQRTEIEEQFIRFLVGARARFLPIR